jgi:hypothetical protein
MELKQIAELQGFIMRRIIPIVFVFLLLAGCESSGTLHRFIVRQPFSIDDGLALSGTVKRDGEVWHAIKPQESSLFTFEIDDDTYSTMPYDVGISTRVLSNEWEIIWPELEIGTFMLNGGETYFIGIEFSNVSSPFQYISLVTAVHHEEFVPNATGYYPGIFSVVPELRVSSNWDINAGSAGYIERLDKYDIRAGMQISYTDTNNSYVIADIAYEYIRLLESNGFLFEYSSESWGATKNSDFYIYYKDDIRIAIDVFDGFNNDYYGIHILLGYSSPR